jgi:hypothetical protein
MVDSPSRKYGLLQDLFLLAVSVSILPQELHPLEGYVLTGEQLGGMWYLAQNVVSSLPMGAGDPEKEQHEQARLKATANLRRLNKPRDDSDSEDDTTDGERRKQRSRKEHLELDQYESQIALEVVAPEDIPVGFDGEVRSVETQFV